MPLTIVVGTMGSGKTLLITYFALKSKIPVLANYHIKSENYHELHIDSLLGDLPYKHVKVLIDEAYVYLESRVSMSKLNKYMSYVLFQSRKKGVDMILTAQLLQSLDRRFIDLADYIIGCRQTKKGFLYVIVCVKNMTKTRLFISYKMAEKIWSKYDTLEVIMPPNIDDLRQEITAIDRKKLKEKIDMLEKLFREKYPILKKVTHAKVDSFLLDTGESIDAYSYHLYARLS